VRGRLHAQHLAGHGQVHAEAERCRPGTLCALGRGLHLLPRLGRCPLRGGRQRVAGADDGGDGKAQVALALVLQLHRQLEPHDCLLPGRQPPQPQPHNVAGTLLQQTGRVSLGRGCLELRPRLRLGQDAAQDPSTSEVGREAAHSGRRGQREGIGHLQGFGAWAGEYLGEDEVRRCVHHAQVHLHTPQWRKDGFGLLRGHANEAEARRLGRPGGVAVADLVDHVHELGLRGVLAQGPQDSAQLSRG